MSIIKSIKKGLWSRSSTWEGGIIPSTNDTVEIYHEVKNDVPTITVSGLNVKPSGKLTFRSTDSHTFQTNKNVVVEGILHLTPADPSKIHILRFINVDESRFVGDGDTPIDSDIGLWVINAGKLILKGSEKQSWTNSISSVFAGATSIDVVSSTDWQIGDEIVIAPTDTPPQYPQDWDDKTGTLTDSYLPKFERRIVTSITGNTVSFSTPLIYDHLAVNSAITSSLGNSNRNWTPEVANLTRNVRIEGTKDDYKGVGYEWQTYHRAHIFIKSSMPPTIRYVEGKWLGPRQLQGGSRPNFVSGRYGLHFHHGEENTNGTKVIGCSFHDIGNKVYVPHGSHGITMTKNVAFNSLGAQFWWDFQHQTHNLILNKNLMMASRLSGVSNTCQGMELGQGDGNSAINNVAVYCNSGDLHGAAAFVWDADNEGVWKFENNLAHSCVAGIFVWQNSSFNHTIIDYDSYNCIEAISHGAYGNSYMYVGGHHYKSKIFNEAVAGNTAAVLFMNIFSDAGGNPYCAKVVESPIPSADFITNKFTQCIFRNYSSAPIEMAGQLPDGHPEKQYKFVDIVNCDFPTGTGYAFVDNDLEPVSNNTKVRVQPVTGQSYQTVKQNGILVNSNISPFAPTNYGTGAGLTGNYYNGSNFSSLAFTRVDSMIMFQQWSYDISSAPNGIHHLINYGGAFSVRWTGKVQPQFSETYTFTLQGKGNHKLWINGTQIINMTSEFGDNADSIASSPINLQAGQLYNIEVQHYDSSNPKGCMLFWECPSLGVMSNVPMSQLYV